MFCVVIFSTRAPDQANLCKFHISVSILQKSVLKKGKFFIRSNRIAEIEKHILHIADGPDLCFTTFLKLQKHAKALSQATVSCH